MSGDRREASDEPTCERGLCSACVGPPARRSRGAARQRSPRRGSRRSPSRDPTATGPSSGCTRCCCGRPGSSSAGAGRRSPRSAGEELEDLATQAADDALVAVLAKLGEFRGESRFTTWAYKFALLEAGVRAAAPGLAGPRGRARARAAGSGSPTGLGRCTRRSSSAELLEALRVGDRGFPDRAPAPGVRRPGAQRGPDRRAGRPPRHDARRPLQDAPRRAAAVARDAGRAGAGADRETEEA